jgi:hypothetical protein
MVASVCPEHKLSSALEAVDLPRSTWYYQQKQKVPYAEKHGHPVSLLQEISLENPEYGYRRTTAELQDTYGERVNHKVVQRLHQLWGLVLLRQTRPPQPSGVRKVILAAGNRINLVTELTEIEPFQVAHTDFTELWYANGNQKAYLMPIIGHVCKVVFGWALGESANTKLALTAWERCRKTLTAFQIAFKNLILHHDQDPVYTSYRWTSQLLLNDGVHISYTLNGARGNTETVPEATLKWKASSVVLRMRTDHSSWMLPLWKRCKWWSKSACTISTMSDDILASDTWLQSLT